MRITVTLFCNDFNNSPVSITFPPKIFQDLSVDKPQLTNKQNL